MNSINWKQIKQKYAKSFDIFSEWLRSKITVSQFYQIVNNLVDDVKMNTRDLYDFFDEQGISVIVMPSNYRICINWYYRINGILYDGNCDSRKEAEPAAFLKAFETLEERLNDNTN